MTIAGQAESKEAMHSPTIRDVTVIGGGLAGLSTACALAQSGYSVRLLERRPYVGGRASSYEHPGTSEVIDNCQHILLGCCTNLIGFYRKLGVADQVRWFDSMTFLEPGGKRSVLHPSSLPAPLHNSPSFLLLPRCRWQTRSPSLAACSHFSEECPKMMARTSRTGLLGRVRRSGRLPDSGIPYW